MQVVVETKVVWARSGKRIKRKVRCTVGLKKGRVVSSASTCSKRIDIKKRIRFNRLKAKFKKRFIARARRTKKFNQVSRRVARMNKMSKPKH
jgi:hypothetical protein